MTCLHLKKLAETPLLHVMDVRCTAPRSGWGEEEAGQRPRLALPRQGMFRWQARGETHLVEAGCLLFFEPDEPYRFSHPIEGGDDCTLIAFTPELWEEVVDTRTLLRCARLPPARQYQSALFYRAAPRVAYDALALEELGGYADRRSRQTAAPRLAIAWTACGGPSSPTRRSGHGLCGGELLRARRA